MNEKEKVKAYFEKQEALETEAFSEKKSLKMSAGHVAHMFKNEAVYIDSVFIRYNADESRFESIEGITSADGVWYQKVTHYKELIVTA